MVKKLQEERGYTLALSLFAVVIISLFGVVIASSAITTAKQSHQMDKIYRTTHIAEMGVTYVEDRVRDYIDEHPPEPKTTLSKNNIRNYIDTMLSEIDAYVNGVTIDEQYPERKFQLLHDYTISVSDDLNEAIVTVSVRGIDGDKEKDLTATIMLVDLLSDIDVRRFDHNHLEPPNFLEEEDYDWQEHNWSNMTGEETKGKETETIEYETYDEDVNVYSDAELSYYNIEVNNLNVEGQTSVTQESNLKVNGDANFNNNVTLSQNSSIMIDGHCFVEGIFKTQQDNKKGQGEGEPKFTVCGNVKFYKKVDFNGNYMEIGGNAVFEEKFNLTNGSYRTGRSTYLKKGLLIDAGNSSKFQVGEDLYIDAATGSYSSQAGTFEVYNNIIFLNVKDKTDLLFDDLKNNIHVKGDVIVHYKDDQYETEINPISHIQIKEYTGKEKKNEGGHIVYHYPLGSVDFLEECSVYEVTDPADLISKLVEVKY
ncbi:hypothetical protein [Salirhabdus salicampi]|uniref:hypothetical protein n=1 Tax=Salirhabdus salicampi TaxID=476102 RepID=UPI0020C2133A|nr:hypothetical protein [Salirhabdus salicampi]MCP8617930.1 hypothetical protein [Salirhabdus salicampi]